MADLEIGATLAGYRIEELLARGGMGVVYRATHVGLERPVALKVIAAELAGRPGFRERFQRESRLAARLDHPAVVPVYDSREVDGELVVAMRLVEGGDLRRLIDREGPLPPALALDLLDQVAAALDAAHAAGIVHRDVKPHNVLVEGERSFLSDFGLAKALDESGASSASVVGTAHYMSPEQWRGEAVGPASDVYSLGCVLYEALTGVVPFVRAEAETPPQLPEGMGEAIERAVDSDPGRRYPSATALVEAARAGSASELRPTRVLSRPDGGRTLPLASPTRRPRWRPGRRPLLIGAGALALLVIAAVLAIVLGGGDGVSVSAPIPVGRGPLRVATGAGGVWVTSEPDGTLTRIDPASASVSGRPLRLGAGLSGVAVGAGSVWVADAREGSVIRVDPAGPKVLARIPVGGRPGAVAFGGDRLWVADEDGAGVTAIAAHGNRVLARRLAPRAAPLRLAVGAGGLWVSSASTSAVRRIDLGTLAVGAPILVGRGPAGITVGRGLVWVANSRSGTVTRVDPSLQAISGEPLRVGGRPGGIDAGTSVVWVADSEGGSVRRLSLEDGEPVGGPISVGTDPGAVAVGGAAVWVADNGDGSVTRVEP